LSLKKIGRHWGKILKARKLELYQKTGWLSSESSRKIMGFKVKKSLNSFFKNL
jgi:hypothetical protein